MDPALRPGLLDAARTGAAPERVEESAAAYRALHADADPSERKRRYTELVDRFYELVTDFYRFGWGESFHFAPRDAGESFEASLVRHQHWLALQGGLDAGQRVLDVGCGVCGPMREIARLTGARITGLNHSAYQVGKGREALRDAGLDGQCEVVEGDFMAMPFADATFDAIYQIEATAHAPDKAACYGEIARVLKPGGLFVSYEWCTTPGYDASDAVHYQLKRDIEEGNALPDIASFAEVDAALRAAGFVIEASGDRAVTAHPSTPWYLPLTGRERSVRGFPRSSVGRRVTRGAVRVLEAVRVAPRGATNVSDVLNLGADALVAAGEKGIFTPMYFTRARR